MEVRHLRYFVAIAEEGSVSAAARRLLIAQPALSRQLHALERHVGAPLFSRSGHGVELTDEGSRLLIDARRTIDAFDDALLNARARNRSGAQGARAARRLRIGLFPGRHATSELTAPMLRVFRAEHPDVAVDVIDLHLHDFGSALHSGRVDVALTRSPLVEDGSTLTPLFDEPRAVLLHATHPLAGAARLGAADLEPLQASTWLDRGPLPEVFWDYHTLGDVWDVADLRRTASCPVSGEQMVEAVVRDGTVVIAAASAVRRWPAGPVTAPRLSGLPGSTAVVASRSGDHRPLVSAFAASARSTTERLVHLVPEATLAPLPDVPRTG